MHTKKCNVAGCIDKKTGKRFVTQPKETVMLAKQALTMHHSRKHGNMKGAPQHMAAKKSITAPISKRKYTKRKPEPVVEQGCARCRYLTDLCHTLLEAVGKA